MKLVIYKLLALIAFASALGLGIITLHFTLSRAEILITTREQGKIWQTEIILPVTFTDTNSLISDKNVSENAETDEIKKLREQVLKNDDEIAETGETQRYGTIAHTIPISIEAIIIPEGTGAELEDYATGAVTIISELPFAQSLVQKTRLLTPDGILFRTTNRVTVPSRGTAEVAVKADQKGKNGDIAPTTFTIPGLSLERQKLIYGKSSEQFTGGARIVKRITSADLERGNSEALAKLADKAIENFNESGIAITRNRIFLRDAAFESDGKVGEEKEKFATLASAQAYGVDFDEEIIRDMTKTSFEAELPEGKDVIGYNDGSFSYTIQEINPDIGEIKITAEIEAFTTLDETKEIIDLKELAGLSAKEIQAKLLKNKAINAVEVRFSPFWATRAPRIPDKIAITIKK